MPAFGTSMSFHDSPVVDINRSHWPGTPFRLGAGGPWIVRLIVVTVDYRTLPGTLPTSFGKPAVH